MPDRDAIIVRVDAIVIDVSTDLAAEEVGMLQRAQKRLEDTRGFRITEKLGNYPTTTGVQILTAFPTGWSGPRLRPAVYDGLAWKKMTWVPSDGELHRLGVDPVLDPQGAPKYLYEDAINGNIEQFPLPDAGSVGFYQIQVPYWGRDTTLSAGTTENWFTSNAEDCLVWYTAAEALLFNRDREESLLYLAKATAEEKRLKKVEKRKKMRGAFNLTPILDVHGNTEQGRM